MMLDFLPGSSTALDSVDADSEESAITTIGRRLGQKLVVDDLTAEEEVKYCSENCQTVTTALISQSSCSLFTSFVSRFPDYSWQRW
jgi:hypothetical protein